jgi:hypothetical protein
MAKRLTEKHPLDIKLKKIMSFMEELNISIHFDGMHMIVADNETDVEAHLKDSDNNSDVWYLPYGFEFKLIIED